MKITKNNQNLQIFIVLISALFYCYEYFIRVSPSIMAPQLLQTFNLNATSFGAFSAYYFYAYVPLQLIVGILVDKYNVQRLLILAMLACIVGTLLIFSAHTIYLAKIGRFSQGLGSAFAFVGSLRLAANEVKTKYYAIFSGLIGSSGFIGAGLSDVILSHISISYGWRYATFCLLILGIMLIFSMLILNKTVKKPISSIHDVKENLSIQQFFREMYSVIKIRKMWLLGLFAMGMFLPVSVFATLWGDQYIIQVYQISASTASFAIAFVFFGWGIGAIMSGWMGDLLQSRLAIMRFGALLAFSLSLIFLYWPPLSYWLLCILFFLFGITLSTEILCFVLAKEDKNANQSIGTKIAFVNFLSMLGGMVFQKGVGEILDWQWTGMLSHGHRIYSIANYQCALAIIPISLLIAFMSTLMIKNSSTISIRLLLPKIARQLIT